MLSLQQKNEFYEQGFTRIPHTAVHQDVETAALALWRRLAESNIHRDLPATWQQPKPKGFQATSKNAQFDSLFEDSTFEALDELLGVGNWRVPKHWGQTLLSLPTDEQWCVPNNMWHLDLPTQMGNPENPGVQVFICIEDITSRCGATVVAAGSHRLIGRWFLENGLPKQNPSSQVQAFLVQEYEWFQQLRSKVISESRDELLLAASHVNGSVRLQVQELTGNKGDVILMHPYLLHAPAANIGPNLRLALTQRIYSVSQPKTI